MVTRVISVINHIVINIHQYTKVIHSYTIVLYVIISYKPYSHWSYVHQRRYRQRGAALCRPRHRRCWKTVEKRPGKGGDDASRNEDTTWSSLNINTDKHISMYIIVYIYIGVWWCMNIYIYNICTVSCISNTRYSWFSSWYLGSWWLEKGVLWWRIAEWRNGGMGCSENRVLLNTNVDWIIPPMGISGSNRWRYVSTIFLARFSGDIPWNLGLQK